MKEDFSTSQKVRKFFPVITVHKSPRLTKLIAGADKFAKLTQ